MRLRFIFSVIVFALLAACSGAPQEEQAPDEQVKITISCTEELDLPEGAQIKFVMYRIDQLKADAQAEMVGTYYLDLKSFPQDFLLAIPPPKEEAKEAQKIRYYLNVLADLDNNRVINQGDMGIDYRGRGTPFFEANSEVEVGLKRLEKTYNEFF